MNNWCICWFSRIFLLGILIFKWLTARRLYKSFGVKGLSRFEQSREVGFDVPLRLSVFIQCIWTSFEKKETFVPLDIV
jgi:hypothetical protein